MSCGVVRFGGVTARRDVCTGGCVAGFGAARVNVFGCDVVDRDGGVKLWRGGGLDTCVFGDCVAVLER